ncbi:MAG: ATP-binding protein [Dehalococcoidia bacterium]|nr:ATP-binding protein [Dehalococcoidia bacterium]
MSFLSNMTLGRRIILLTAVWVLIGIGLFGFLSMRALSQSTEAMLRERLTVAHLIADYADEVLGGALAQLKYTAQDVDMDGPQSEIEAQIAGLETAYSRMSISTLNILLLNSSGRVVWSSRDYDKLAGTEMFAYASISQTMENREPQISGLVSAPLTGTPAILLSGVTSLGKLPRGVLVVAIDIAHSSIGGFIRPIKLGETGYIEIVDQNGLVIARTEPGHKLAPFEKSDHPERFAALIAAGEPTVGTCHTCHEAGQQVERRDVLAFTRVSTAPWGVAIRQSEKEALAPTEELRLRLLLSGGGLFFVALLFVGVTTREVVRRIGTLAAASRRIAEGDLSSPVIAHGKDEIGTLGRTFDEMRLKLKTSYEETQQRTRELSSLLTVTEILASSPDLSSLLQAVVAKAVEVIPAASSGALLLKDAKDGSFVVRAVSGPDMAPLSRVVPGPGAGGPECLIPGQANEGIRIQAREMCSAFLRASGAGLKARSAVCAPVVRQAECVGGIVVVSLRDDAAFSEPDVRLLQAIADNIAMAIEKAQLTGEAEQARAWREADRLKSQFISSISHELRTPLASIKGYSTSLLRQDVSWDEVTQREFLQIIDEKTDELRDLIDKLLLMARVEAGALKLETEPLLMPRLAQKVVQEAAPRTAKHEFAIDFPPNFPVLEADVRYIEQVLRNLVENAIKYSPDGGRIAVSGEVRSDGIVVGVSDQGVGIAPEHQSRVFGRFYRVDNPSTRGTPGSGLGLAIAKGHVEAHGGRIWVESEPGNGTTFYFSLPLDHHGASTEGQEGK